MRWRLTIALVAREALSPTPAEFERLDTRLPSAKAPGLAESSVPGRAECHYEGMGIFSKRKPGNNWSRAAAVEPTFSEPNESEKQFIAGNLSILRDLQVDILDAKSIESCYNQMLDEWLAAAKKGRSDPNNLINIIGIGLGEHLVQLTAMVWVVASDSEGVELAVRGSEGGWLVYPANFVAKRWVKRERGAFIPAFTKEIISRVDQK